MQQIANPVRGEDQGNQSVTKEAMQDAGVGVAERESGSKKVQIRSRKIKCGYGGSV